MGMLFNTEATTKMVALVNRHFGSDRSGGAIESVWRANKADVAPVAGNRLWTLANTYGVLPDPSDDKFGSAKARWKKWLNHLQAAANTVAAEAPPPPAPQPPATLTGAGGYLPPSLATYPHVDDELRRQIFNALNDTSCVEIAFTVIPSSSISINQCQFVWMPATQNATYTAIVTINTKRVDDL